MQMMNSHTEDFTHEFEDEPTHYGKRPALLPFEEPEPRPIGQKLGSLEEDPYERTDLELQLPRARELIDVRRLRSLLERVYYQTPAGTLAAGLHEEIGQELGWLERREQALEEK